MAFCNAQFAGIWPLDVVEIDERDARIKMPWWITRVSWSIAEARSDQDPSLKVGYNSFAFVTPTGTKRLEVWRQEFLQSFLGATTTRYDCSMLSVLLFLSVLTLWNFDAVSSVALVIWLMLILGIRVVPELFFRPHWIISPPYERALKCTAAFVVVIVVLSLVPLLRSNVNCGNSVARDCRSCPVTTSGIAWCSGDCTYYDNQCTLRDSIPKSEDEAQSVEEIDDVPVTRNKPVEVVKPPVRQTTAAPVVERNVVDKDYEPPRAEPEVQHDKYQDRRDDHSVVVPRKPKHTVYSEVPVEGHPILMLLIYLIVGCLYKSGVLFN